MASFRVPKTTRQSSELEFGGHEQRSPLVVYRKNIAAQMGSMKSGKYDTLKANVNVSEILKPYLQNKTDSDNYQVIKQAKAGKFTAGAFSKFEMKPMSPKRQITHQIIKGDNVIMKSTLSNNTANSPSDKRANSNGDSAMEKANLALNSFASTGSSNGFAKGLKSGLSSPPNEAGPNSSSDIKVDEANNQMLEIKGSDGDKIMILQFDNRQLQVFNEILEKQMQQSKEDIGNSIMSSSIDGGNSIQKQRKANAIRTPDPGNYRLETEPNLAANSGSVRIGSQNHQNSGNSGTTSGEESKKLTAREYVDNAGRLRNLRAKAHQMHVNNLPCMLNQSSFSTQQNIQQFKLQSQSPPAKTLRGHNLSPLSHPSNRSKQSGGDHKKAIELQNFIQTWQEDSRMSSPGGFAPFDSPKNHSNSRFYLGNPKYSHNKHSKENTAHKTQQLQPQHHLASNNNTQPQKEVGDICYRDGKEFTVMRANTFHQRHNNASKAGQGRNKNQKLCQLRQLRSQEASNGPKRIQVPMNSEDDSIHTRRQKHIVIKVPRTVKASSKPRSFLQGLTKKFGPNLVGEYLRTQNLTRMRRLIKLEQSQHCNCIFREQMMALFTFQQEHQSQIEEQQLSQGGTSIIDEKWSVMQDGVRESSPSQLTAEPKTVEQPDRASIEREEEILPHPPMVTAKPCKNCLTQSNFADLLCRVYQDQVQQKLQPIVCNQIQAQAAIRQQNFSNGGLPSPKSNAGSLTSLPHHTKYFTKPVDQKRVNDLKKQCMLRKARNSRVFRVTSINNLRSFDRHLERQLNTREGDRDSAMRRAVLLKNPIYENISNFMGSTQQLLFQQENNYSRRETDETPKLTKQVYSSTNLNSNSTNNINSNLSLSNKQRVSCDIIAQRMMNERNGARETTSTPSLTPSLSQPPSMVLNPAQEEARSEKSITQQRLDNKQKRAAKKASAKEKGKTSFKMRNYSTMTKQPKTRLSSECMRDYLSNVLPQTKSTNQVAQNLYPQAKTNSGGALSSHIKSNTSKGNRQKVRELSPAKQDSDANTVEGALSQTPTSTDIQLSQLKQITGLKKSALSKISIGSRKRKPEGSSDDLMPVLQSLSSSQMLLVAKKDSVPGPHPSAGVLSPIMYSKRQQLRSRQANGTVAQGSGDWAPLRSVEMRACIDTRRQFPSRIDSPIHSKLGGSRGSDVLQALTFYSNQNSQDRSLGRLGPNMVSHIVSDGPLSGSKAVNNDKITFMGVESSRGSGRQLKQVQQQTQQQHDMRGSKSKRKVVIQQQQQQRWIQMQLPNNGHASKRQSVPVASSAGRKQFKIPMPELLSSRHSKNDSTTKIAKPPLEERIIMSNDNLKTQTFNFLTTSKFSENDTSKNVTPTPSDLK